MTTEGYETDLSRFEWLIEVINRHHLKQIAESVSLKINRKQGKWYFTDKNGSSVSVD